MSADATAAHVGPAAARRERVERQDLFTGWVDVDLTAKGEDEARRGGQLLAEPGSLPDVVHTSLLRRAIRTAHLALDAADRHWIPVSRTGGSTSGTTARCRARTRSRPSSEFGEEQFMLWRRSYDTPPPPLADDDEYSQVGDPRYADLPAELVPRTECLKDVVDADAALLVRRDRARTCGAAGPCSSPRTATRCARWSSTSTASATRTSPGSTSRPASRCSTSWTTNLRPLQPAGSTSTRTAAAAAIEAVEEPGPLTPAGGHASAVSSRPASGRR